MNIDALVVAGNGFISIRIVFWDYQRFVLAACAKSILGCFDVETVELLALQEGLLCAVD